MTEKRTIDDYHRTRESGTGCPETNGGPHYFAHIAPPYDKRICIDCGEPEPEA